MSIMDFFSSQGTAVPSTGSSGGDWEDWFLDMENRAPFGGRTAYPDPDAERGDWIDWYLNREGPAGRFRGSRRPKYGIDYLFNGGGSVQSRPRRSVQSGSRTRQNTDPGYNTGIRLAATNNAGANQMMSDYNIDRSDYNTNAKPYSFEAREPIRNYLMNQWIKRKASEEDQNLLREQGYELDAPIGFNFRTGQPGSNQGGGWTQFIPKPGNDMLNWQFDTKYGDFGFGIGDDQVGFNYKVGFGG